MRVCPSPLRIIVNSSLNCSKEFSTKTCNSFPSRNWANTPVFLRGRPSLIKILIKRRLSDKFPPTFEIPVENIRNFSIIAHVDHGKSTLADRLLEMAGAIDKNCGRSQVLDKLQVERERGITVKAQSASLIYNVDGTDYMLNLIDTPGHVDFSNEVSRSLSACQGVILLVDANQGVQAQTVANFYMAFTKELVIIPVLNKIDLKNANPEAITDQLKNIFGIEENEVLKISAKLGTGVDAVLRAIVERIPPPPVNRNKPFRALLFDSWYDRYRGAVSLLYVVDGKVQMGDMISSALCGKLYEVKGLGILTPQETPVECLVAGQVGFMFCNMRSSQEAHIGDTIFHEGNPVAILPEFKASQPMVFAGVYPVDQSHHVELRNAIERLVLNDSAVTSSVESRQVFYYKFPALGLGWRLGFLGILHLEVFSQRLLQEFNAEVVVTAPSVTYKATVIGEKNIKKYRSSEISFSNPSQFPDPQIVSEYFEPFVLGTIISPDKYLGPIMQLCMDRRGIQKSMQNIDNHTVMMQFILPLNEIVIDFHDTLKSVSSGYASFDYEEYGYFESKLVKLVILLNGIPVDELSAVVHTSKASIVGHKICAKLKELIPRQMVLIAIQAAVGGKIVARETLKPYRKDVTAKLYGGDVTRRKKLLKQQAEGKKKMRMLANINVPKDIFIDVLKRN
ncbi:Translation factor GUF1 homolog, mitochondrial [Gryllus bimaculatus]|nr:Translation factor GUF1 homolog, mitochondrial [Gryllus bimaculatus]